MSEPMPVKGTCHCPVCNHPYFLHNSIGCIGHFSTGKLPQGKDGECCPCREVVKDYSLAPAPSEAPHFPIALNDSQEQCVKIWAADMRCWATPETVEFNLRTFARKIIGESGQSGAPSEAKPSVTEAAKNLLHAMDTCHVCGTLLEVEGGPVYCKDGCTRYCDAHEGEECESISALHQKLRDAMGSEAKPASEEK